MDRMYAKKKTIRLKISFQPIQTSVSGQNGLTMTCLVTLMGTEKYIQNISNDQKKLTQDLSGSILINQNNGQDFGLRLYKLIVLETRYFIQILYVSKCQ